MSQIRPFIRLHNIKHVESQNIDNILGVYFMDKKRVLFGFGIFAMLVIFTVLNIIIGRYYYNDKQIVEKKMILPLLLQEFRQIRSPTRKFLK